MWGLVLEMVQLNVIYTSHPSPQDARERGRASVNNVFTKGNMI
jgi:hypothetical protein